MEYGKRETETRGRSSGSVILYRTNKRAGNAAEHSKRLQETILSDKVRAEKKKKKMVIVDTVTIDNSIHEI